MALAALPLHAAHFAHAFQLALEPRDPILDPRADRPPIGFRPVPASQFRRSAAKGDATFSLAVAKILQLRQFDLQPAFATPRPLRENIENELASIQDLARQQDFPDYAPAPGKVRR